MIFNGGIYSVSSCKRYAKETIDELDIKEDGIYVDCTLGGAGHALYLLNQLNDDGRLIAIDQDTTALENAKEAKITQGHVCT